MHIDFGKDGAEKTKLLFDAVLEQKADIEKEFGEPLEWLRLKDKRASMISKTLKDRGLVKEEKRPAIQDAMLDVAIRLDKALRPRLSRIGIHE